MSADAEMVPVAWHIGPIFKLGSEKPGRFGADDSRWQPLYSADTIAALKKVIAAADAMRAAGHLIGPGGVDACPKCIAEKAYDLERAAIDAAATVIDTR